MQPTSFIAAGLLRGRGAATIVTILPDLAQLFASSHSCHRRFEVVLVSAIRRRIVARRDCEIDRVEEVANAARVSVIT
jgi:hypothetical protein